MQEIRINFNGKDERYRISDKIRFENVTEEQLKELRENHNILSLSSLLERDGNGFYRAEYIFRAIGDANIFCDFGSFSCRVIDEDLNSFYEVCYEVESGSGYVIEYF